MAARDVDFEALQTALHEAYAAGDYAAALRAAERAHGEYPAERTRTWYWRACLLSRLGDAEGAVAALETGMADGAWWGTGMLDGDEDFVPLRALPGWAPLRDACARLHAAARGASRPSCLVVAPATATWEPRSVLFLHRHGDTARRFAAAWTPLVDEGWTLVVPQSSQPSDSARFCWDDREAALVEVRGHLDDCVRRRGIPRDGLVIAGASQGAGLAVEIAAEAGLPWLAVIPSLGRGGSVVERLSTGVAPAHGAFVLGGADPASARALAAARSLQSAGVPVSVRSLPGTGHVLSAGIVALAAEALRELTDPGSAGADAGS